MDEREDPPFRFFDGLVVALFIALMFGFAAWWWLR